MRHQISLQSFGTAVNTYGQASTTGTWSTDKTVRAAIEPLGGNEAVLARQIYPKATFRVTIDYQSTLNATGATRTRVLFGSRALYIGSIRNYDEENFQQELLCGEER